MILRYRDPEYSTPQAWIVQRYITPYHSWAGLRVYYTSSLRSRIKPRSTINVEDTQRLLDQLPTIRGGLYV